MNKKLENLERKLNIASDLIKEFEIDENLPVEINDAPVPAVYENGKIDNDVFEIDNLKSDFMLIRQNVLKLINMGQRFMETVSLVDPSDLKASQIQAISGMHETLGNNLKLLIDLYKQIADIETLRNKRSSKIASEANQTISTGNTITNHNQILFAGSSNDLLTAIKDIQSL